VLVVAVFFWVLFCVCFVLRLFLWGIWGLIDCFLACLLSFFVGSRVRSY
jgi:hypothetical protein